MNSALSIKVISATVAAITVFSMARMIGAETWSAVLFFSIGYFAKQLLDK